MTKEYLNQTQRKFVLALLIFGGAQWGLIGGTLTPEVWMQTVIADALILAGAVTAEKIFKK